MTKIAFILRIKQMSQRELHGAIMDKFKLSIGEDRISKIVNGKIKIENLQLRTAKMIAETLEVNIDDIVD
jgi:hypothetical protein